MIRFQTSSICSAGPSAPPSGKSEPEPVTQENRNLILAVVLSALVLFGWTFASERLFPAPKTPPAATATAAGGPVVPGASANVPMVAPSADKLVAQGARVRIETPRLEGSINLTGARFDDLVLKDHLVSLPPSKPIRL